ncbi:hypothetical protein AAY473_007378 [Plecturocebus cupreus]
MKDNGVCEKDFGPSPSNSLALNRNPPCASLIPWLALLTAANSYSCSKHYVNVKCFGGRKDFIFTRQRGYPSHILVQGKPVASLLGSTELIMKADPIPASDELFERRERVLFLTAFPARSTLCEFKTSLTNMAKPCTKNPKISWVWWWIPVIPATLESEAGELLEPRNRGCMQNQQNSTEFDSTELKLIYICVILQREVSYNCQKGFEKDPTRPGVVAHTCNPSTLVD